MQVLLAVPDHVRLMLVKAAVADAVYASTLKAGAPIGLLPRMSCFPRSLLVTAVRACAPSIDSKLIWSICLNISHLPQCHQIVCQALPCLTALTTLSFTLSAGQLPVKLLSKHVKQLRLVASAICSMPRLSQLLLTAHDLSSDSLVAITDALPRATQLEILQFRCALVGNKTAHSLLATLPRLSRLRCFSLTVTTKLSDKARQLLSACISRMTNLSSLHLNHPCPCLNAATQLLTHLPHKHLDTLSLTYHFTDPIPSAAVGQSFVHAIARATMLSDLSITTNTPLPGLGSHLRLITQMMQRFDPLSRCGAPLQRLKRLSLCGALEATCGHNFSEFLLHLSLSELQISGAREAPHGVATISTGLTSLPTDAYAHRLPRMQDLTMLDLSNSRMDTLCGADNVLASSLEQLHMLRCLKLIWARPQACGGWTSIRLNMLARAISTRTGLEELHMGGGKPAERLMHRVYLMASLQKVVVYGGLTWASRTHPDGSRFSYLRALTDVRLIGTCAGPGMIHAFCPVLATMTSLQVLILSYHSMDAADAAALGTALWPQAAVGAKRDRPGPPDGLRQLVCLGLGGCRMGWPLLQLLLPAVQGLAGSRLEQVMLWGNAEEALLRAVPPLLEAHPDLMVDAAVPGLP